MDLATFREQYTNSGMVECVDRFELSLREPYLAHSRNRLNFYTNSRNNATDQIFIFFSDEKSVGIKTMRK
jgi:DNA-directed RNA polymerase I, II, and III subunit RPABC1